MSAEECEVQVGVFDDSEPLPLIIRPKDGKDSLEFLQAWISRNTRWLDQKILEHGKPQLYTYTYTRMTRYQLLHAPIMIHKEFK